MFRHWFAVGFAALTLVASLAADVPLSHYARVEIAPTKTSIYIGTVTMTMPVFVRRGGTYESTYTAKVFPFFFYNEKGTLTIDIGDETLRRLEHGEPIEFEGHGVSTSGEQRHVEGRAVPTGATGGKIKVRVFVTKKIQLIFNTTYRFVPQMPAPDAGPRSRDERLTPPSEKPRAPRPTG